jgi:hypothetical protein
VPHCNQSAFVISVPVLRIVGTEKSFTGSPAQKDKTALRKQAWLDN